MCLPSLKAGTKRRVNLEIEGQGGVTLRPRLDQMQSHFKKRGETDVFFLRSKFKLGELASLRVSLGNGGFFNTWALERAVITELGRNREWTFGYHGRVGSKVRRFRLRV